MSQESIQPQRSKIGRYLFWGFVSVVILRVILAFMGYGLSGALGFTHWLPGKYWDAVIIVDSVASLPDLNFLDRSGLLEEYPLDDWDQVVNNTRSIHAQFLKSDVDTSRIAILTIDAQYSSISDSGYVHPVVKGDTLSVRLDYNDVGWIPFNTMFRKKFGFHIAEIKNAAQIYAKHGQSDNMGIYDKASVFERFWIIIVVCIVVGIVIIWVKKKRSEK